MSKGQGWLSLLWGVVFVTVDAVLVAACDASGCGNQSNIGNMKGATVSVETGDDSYLLARV